MRLLLRTISCSSQPRKQHFTPSSILQEALYRSHILRNTVVGTWKTIYQQRRMGQERAMVSAMTDVCQNVDGLYIGRVPMLSDNYSWILHDAPSGSTAVVDPAEEEPIVRALESRGWTLTHILNTHHHWDHTGGNLALKERYKNLTIVGPRADRERIPGIDVELEDGDVLYLGTSKMQCFDTPGHTKGHVTYYFKDAKALFPGDTLFLMGCGRLFEGTPEDMWHSLSKLVRLPRDTMVYCAHEYTLSNAKFAVHVDPSNPALQKRFKEVEECRKNGIPTVPSSLGVELDTNPFLRPWSKEIRSTLHIHDDASDSEAFGVIRKAKDSF